MYKIKIVGGEGFDADIIVPNAPGIWVKKPAFWVFYPWHQVEWIINDSVFTLG